jgi:hypothetical protein
MQVTVRSYENQAYEGIAHWDYFVNGTAEQYQFHEKVSVKGLNQ